MKWLKPWPKKPICIVAMEWDGFGSRCNEILNALLISKLVECDFKFTWPKGEQEILGDIDNKLAYFSQNFIDAHHCDSINGRIYNLEVNSEKSIIDLQVEMLKSGSRNFRLSRASRSIPKVKNVDTQPLYRALGQTIWSQEVWEIKKATELIFHSNQVHHSIHIRSGDLLTGAWKQYPDIEKYLPIGIVFNFLEKNSSNKFAIISDTFEISEVISKRFHNTISSSLFHNQIKSSELFVDLQDLFIMSLGDKVYAPLSSVYSMLGARLGGTETSLIYQDFTIEEWKSTFKSTIESQTYVGFSVEVAKKMQARDISWLVDRLLSQLTGNEFEEATRIAVEKDDCFVVGLSQYAVSLLLAGDFLGAERLNSIAIEKADLVTNVHGDPIYYSLVTSLVIQNIKMLCSLDFSKPNMRALHENYSKVFNQHVYQIPKWHQIDPNLRYALQIIDAFVSDLQRNPENNLKADLLDDSSFRSKVLDEFQRNMFNKCKYEHFLMHLTNALIRTMEATIIEPHIRRPQS